MYIYICDAFTCFGQLMAIFRRQHTAKEEAAQQQTQTPNQLYEEEKTLPGPPRAAIYPIFR
jgi:hypothetical protein